MSEHKAASRWPFVALIGISISASCVAPTLGEAPRGEGAREAEPSPSPGSTESSPELRAAYIAAVQSGAGEGYRATRDAWGAARFVHSAQGIEATLDGYEVRLAPAEARSWELSLAASEVGCAGDPELGLPGGAAEIAGNRVEIARGSLREWYVNGPLGIEQGFTLEQPPSCEGTKVVTLDVGGSAEPKLVDADRDGQGEAVAFVDAEGATVARYTDLFVNDATGKRLPAWITVEEGRIALHVDDAEAAYPVQIDPLIWAQQAHLMASDGEASDEFGYSAAISGDTAIVGAPFDKINGLGAPGSAYVFTRVGAAWFKQQKLFRTGIVSGDNFGFSVALSGDTAIVGAPLAEEMGASSNEGAAYVFTRQGGVWTEEATLVPYDGSVSDEFGYSVALSGDTAIVGAPYEDIGANVFQGAAYVFTRGDTSWGQQQKLTASDGASFDKFGHSVALSGDTAIVGVPEDYVVAARQGSAHVFTRSGEVWTPQQMLTASDGASNDYFGHAVALSGDTALVGARQADVGANFSQGAAYEFTRSGATWTQGQKLSASDGGIGEFCGERVALLGDMALVGCASKDVGGNSQQGAAYLFTRSGGAWTQDQIFSASDGAANDHFSSSVALSADTALVGARWDDVDGKVEQGSVYVFVLPKPTGGACASDAECIGGSCVDAVCCDAVCGGGATDDCQVCSVAAGAAVDGQCALLSAGTACRSAGGACDVAESCDGASGDCPADEKASAGTECRPSGGPCDVAESCDGASSACPADAKALAGMTCRPPVAPCDAAETCDGVSLDCPADAKVAAGTPCRASDGACDIAESCDGVSAACPEDAKAPAGTTCRAAAGACDVAETCDGAAAACPDDAKVAAGGVCRPSTRECDLAETCDGAAADCPADMNAPNGVPCGGDGECISGTCVGGHNTGSGGSGGGSSSGSGGSSSGSGGTGSGGSSGSGDESDDDEPPARAPSGCDCRTAGPAPGEPSYGALSLLAFALFMARRSPRAAPRAACGSRG